MQHPTHNSVLTQRNNPQSHFNTYISGRWRDRNIYTHLGIWCKYCITT